MPNPREVAFAIRGYPSIHHAYSARLFALYAAEIQSEFMDRPIHEQPHSDLMACSQASVMASAALLEAAISELYTDVVDHIPNSHYQPIPSTIRSKLEAKWSKTFDHSPTLVKYSETVELWGLPNMDPGSEVVRNAADLLELRNRIVHPKPGTHVIQTSSPSIPLTKPEIAERLANRLPPHPWHKTHPGEAYRALFTAECASWGVEASRNFLEDFFARIGTGAAYRSSSVPARTHRPSS